jgi:hypothetical protein
MILRRATERLREVRSLPVLLAALLITAGGDLSAQDRGRSRPSDSGSRGHAVPRSESAPSPRPSSPPPSSSGGSASPSSPNSSASPSGPSRRHAVPGSPGQAQRQPRSRDRNDPDYRGGGGHGYRPGYGYYPRGYYGGYYGPSWWWSPYGYWGGWYWLGDNYWPYDPHHYGRPYYERGYRSYGNGDAGALDLDVSPGRTQVYLDGQYIGTVDQYDGFPTYLWLDQGTYDVVLYLDGYKTLARQMTIRPGMVIDVNDRLERGQSTKPEDLVSKSTERRDDRIRYERERRERLDRGDDRDDRDRRDDDEDWRDRVRRDREDRRDQGERIEIEIPESASEQGRLRLEVEPEDASVYLDGRFVGTGQELGSLRRGLLVEPGKHRIAVVRPGRESAEKEFEVEAGEEVDLEIELESSEDR